MHIQIITIGSPKLPWSQAGIAEYMKRLQKFADCQLIHVKENKKTTEKIIHLTEGSKVILLDETGREYTSSEFAGFLEKQRDQSHKLSFLIGGPNGHDQDIRNLTHEALSLSRLTLPHDMAMLFFTETLYRSLSIINNHPYHRV